MAFLTCRRAQIPKDKSTLVPAAIDLGFDFHDAEPSQVVMNLWLPQDSPSTLPTSAHTTIGARFKHFVSCVTTGCSTS